VIRNDKVSDSTHFDHVQLQDHRHGGTHFMLESVHLETIALENNFGPGSVSDPFEHRGHLGQIDRGRGHENIEMNWK
jgi:hypothetical protein